MAFYLKVHTLKKDAKDLICLILRGTATGNETNIRIEGYTTIGAA